jgi:TonB family protein
MNNCPNCGAMLLEQTTVCPVCRQPLAPAQSGAGWQQQQPAAPPVQPWPQSPYGPPGASSGNTSRNVALLVVIGVMLVLVVAGVAGALVFMKSRKASKAIDNDNYARVYQNPSDSDSAPPTAPTPPGTRPLPNRKAPISGGVLNGKATSLPKPVYPPVARAAHASGTVVVQVTIDESGNVTDARAVSGHPLLQASAVQAARQARFYPTLLSGKPVKVTGTLSYNFVPE